MTKEGVIELARRFGLAVKETEPEPALNEEVAAEDTTRPIVIKTKRQILPS